MTDLLVRPAPGRALGEPSPERSGSIVLAGVTAAVCAAAVGLLAVLVPVVVLWALEPQDGAPLDAAFRVTADLWLLAQGAGLRVVLGSGAHALVGLVPLGLTAPMAALLVRAGRRATDGRPVVRGRLAFAWAAAIAVPYAIIAGVVAVVSGSGTVSAAPWRAAVGALLLSGACTLAGSSTRRPWADARAAVAGAVRGSLVAVLTLLAAGSVLAGASLAVHASAAGAIAHDTGSGVVGSTGLMLVGLALLPNAVVWGLSYTLGTGFAVGAGTSVSPLSTHVGLTPGVPLLAGLPSSTSPTWAAVVLLVPLAAGALGLRASLRWTQPPDAPGGYRTVGVAAMRVALGCGVAVAMLAAVASGPVSDGRMATVGASWWRSGGGAALLVGVGGLVAGSIAVWRRRRTERAAGDGPDPSKP